MPNNVKRKRDMGSSSNGSLSHGIAAEDITATPELGAEAVATYDHEKAWLAVWLAGVKIVSPSVLAACRAALVDSPAASRAALAKYKSSIDPALARILSTVGGYETEHDRTPLHESARRGDLATCTFLITAGAAVDTADKGYRSPRQLATNGACRDLLEHHERVLRTLRRDPAAFVSAVVAHCAALSSPAEPAPKTKLTLRAHHFDPSLLWGARSDACFICFSWLYDVYAAQVASNTPPFVDLPDDCAGDVFEFLPMTMAREELLHVVAHCSSPEAHAWICAVAAAAVMEGATRQLAFASMDKDIAALKTCLTKDIFIDDQTWMGSTALSLASFQGEICIVEVLLEAGADVEAINRNGGDTALMRASECGHTDVVSLLLEAGADANANKKNGYTALMKASFKGCADTVKLLLEAGANVNARGKRGHTALIHASESGHYRIVEDLLIAGAHPDVQDEAGRTALIAASNVGNESCVVRLLDNGANKWARDTNGKSALDLAQNSEIVLILTEDDDDDEDEDENEDEDEDEDEDYYHRVLYGNDDDNLFRTSLP